jgi:prevent-host-death family protein
MKTTAISKLKASLSQYLSIVRSGEDVIITDRGKPIAKIVPLERGDLKTPSHLLELERNGLIRLGSGKIKDNFWKLPRPKDQKGYALKMLLNEREESK